MTYLPPPPYRRDPAASAQQAADASIAGLIAALHAHIEAMQAQTEALREHAHSNLMLSAAVAELLGEEAGKPVRPEEPKEPAPASLDGDE